MVNQDMQDNIQYRSLHNSAEKNIVNAFKIDHNLIAHPMFLNVTHSIRTEDHNYMFAQHRIYLKIILQHEPKVE